MKLLFLFVFFTTISSFASDSVIIEIGGIRHQCTPIENRNPSQCLLTAYNGPYSKDEAQELCENAHSDAPAFCGIEAYRGRFSKSESIALCKGASTKTGPVDCANLAYNGPFSTSESLTLCSHNGTKETAECALSAYNGPYSKEEAIAICKKSHFNKSKLLSQQELNNLIEKTNLKAFGRNEYK